MKLTVTQFLSLIALVVGLVLLSFYVFPNVDWSELIDKFKFNVSDRTAADQEYTEPEEDGSKDDWL